MTHAPLFEDLPANARVLFIRLRNLGEAVLDTANLRALKRWRPDLHVTTLVEALYTDLYAADPELNAIALPRAAQNQKSSFLARLRLIRELRQQKFDAVVNLHGGPTSAQLTFFSGARHRVGARHFRPAYTYNLRIPPAEEILTRKDLHTVEYQFGQFRWLGLPLKEPAATHLYVDGAARTRAQAKLQAAYQIRAKQARTHACRDVTAEVMAALKADGVANGVSVDHVAVEGML